MEPPLPFGPFASLRRLAHGTGTVSDTSSRRALSSFLNARAAARKNQLWARSAIWDDHVWSRADEKGVAVSVRRVSAVVCSSDLARSQTFYEQVVGLTLSEETIPNHLLFECGDGTLLVYGRPAPNTADHTQVRLWSVDVEGDVRELESRGAVFEDYDFPTLKTVNHVATTAGVGKSAWLKDPDGNTLALFQPEL